MTTSGPPRPGNSAAKVSAALVSILWEAERMFVCVSLDLRPTGITLLGGAHLAQKGVGIAVLARNPKNAAYGGGRE